MRSWPRPRICRPDRPSPTFYFVSQLRKNHILELVDAHGGEHADGPVYTRARPCAGEAVTSRVVQESTTSDEDDRSRGVLILRPRWIKLHEIGYRHVRYADHRQVLGLDSQCPWVGRGQGRAADAEWKRRGR